MKKCNTPLLATLPLSRTNSRVLWWLGRCGELDLDNLIKEAFNTTEEAEHGDLIYGSIPLSVRGRLAQLIKDELDECLDRWVADVGEGKYRTTQEAKLLVDADASPRPPLQLTDLFLPILCEAWRNVNYFALAEAILFWAKKWDNLESEHLYDSLARS